MSRNRYRKPKEGLVVPKTSRPPKIGTFTPSADYRVPGQDADIEQLLQDEQWAVARLIDDAVALWGNDGQRVRESDVADGTLRQRAEKLTQGARITARVLTKLRLDSRYPPKRSR